MLTILLSLTVLSGRVARVASVPNTLWTLVTACAIWSLLLPAFGGYTVSNRFSTVTQDFGTRFEHWRDVAALNNAKGYRWLTGTGVGTIPVQYHLNQTHDPFPKSYRYVADHEQRYISIDPGHMALLQRVDVSPGDKLTITATLRAHGSSSLAVSVCPRNILYFDGIGCRSISLKPSDPSQWQVLRGDLIAGQIGPNDPFSWPSTLHISARHGIVDLASITAVTKLDSVIRNGNFSRGMDAWFNVSDYDHLPWHAKNNYLHLWVEQGSFGLTIVLVLMMATFLSSTNNVRRGNTAFIPILGAVTGFAIVGLFGSPLDMPRVALLSYLVLMIPIVVRIVPVSITSTLRAPSDRQHEPSEQAQPNDLIDSLEHLSRLYTDGHIDQQSFEEAKRRVLGK